MKKLCQLIINNQVSKRFDRNIQLYDLDTAKKRYLNEIEDLYYSLNGVSHEDYKDIYTDASNIERLKLEYLDLNVKELPGVKNYLKLRVYNPKSTMFKDDLYKALNNLSDLFQINNKNITKAVKELDDIINNFLSQIGVSIEEVNSIRDREGNTIDAVAKTNIVKGIIEVIENKKDITTLPEEAAHFLVKILGKSHPLVVKMMSEIENHPIYNEVVSKYSDVYKNNKDLLKEEATGKLIADRFINRKTTPTKEETSWFKKVLYVLKKLLGQVSSSDLNSSLESFDKAVELILNPKKLGTIADIDKTLDTDLYQLSSTITQQELNQKLDQTQREIKSPSYTTEEDNRYSKVTGEQIKKRVTDKQQKLFEKIFGKDKAKDINENPDNIIKRNTGIALHNIAEQYLNFKLKKGPAVNLTVPIKGTNERISITNEQYKQLTDYLDNIIQDINNTQGSINSNGIPTIRTENIIYDSKGDIAGTIDLMVVFSDGSVSIYDYKFVNLEESEGVVDTTKLYNKEDSWDMQMSEYKRILREQYKVNKFNKTRMMPINIRYKYANGKMTGKIHSINTGIDPIPLRELTDDVKLNQMLEKLISLKDKLKEEIKTSEHKDRLKIRIRNLTDSIRKIQLEKDVNFILNEIDATAKLVFNGLGISDKNDGNYITNAELREYKEILSLYSKIADNTRNVFSKQKGTEEYKQMLDNLYKANTSALLVLSSIEDEIKNRAIEEAKKLGINDLTRPQKEGSQLGLLLNNLSQINHPIFKTFWKFIKSSQDKTRNATISLEKELKQVTDNLKEWGKSKGLSGVDIFKNIINPNTGDLIAQYKSELYKEIDLQRSKKNAQWFKDNYEQTAEDKAKFEKRKAEEFKRIDIGYAYRGDAFVNALKNRWLKENDLSNDEAWLSEYSYKTLKDKTKWESYEYKFLFQPENKALKEYYDFYKKVNKEIAEILPMNIKSNFVANIHKDMVDMLSENGLMAIKEIGETFAKSLEVREDENSFSYNDPLTGKPLYNTPILYMSPLTDINGKIDLNLKSKDLSKSLLLFANMAYNYKHMNEIKDSSLNIREILASSKQILTDNFGRPIKKEGKFVEGEGNKRTLDTFDSFLNYYIGGQSIQTKDSAFNYKDKTYSRNKLIKNAMQYFGITKLAFNPVSATANYLGAKANLYFAALKEAYFTKEQLNKTHELFAKQDKKYLQAINYFGIGSNSTTFKKANNLSAEALSKMITVDNMYALQKAGDHAIERQLLVSMLMNYGIDSNGKVVKLSKLPENSKSIWDSMSLKDDKIDMSFLTEEQFNDFRRKVDYVSGIVKGQNSEEDVALYKTTLMGMLLGQFRGWMPRMIKERFGEPRFNEDMEQFELGRFRVLIGEFAEAGIINSLKIFLDGLPFINYKYDQRGAQHFYEKYLAENPEIDSSKFTLDDYIEVRRGQLRAAAAEIRLYAAFLAAIAVLAGDWDDDDKPDYKKYWFTRKFISLMDRTQLELGFFLNPSNVTELIKSPVPIWGLITDTKKLLENTLDETKDTFFGEDSAQDKSPIGYRVARMIPLVKPTVDFFEVFEDSGDDVKYKPKKDEKGVQLEY
jgi:hypothetical protein